VSAAQDYSHLVGKVVRVGMRQRRATVKGLLLSWRLIPEGEHGEMFAVIRRRSGSTVFIGGRFDLERAS
jgi:hypothetical protein